jgi:ubiquinone/menaquinone biosynthesis C-methylase UbiE
MSTDLDHKAFHDFEHAGWERAAEHYADAFGPLTSEAAVSLLDAVGVGAGTRMLDVACGPGFVSAAAAGRGGDVVGVDFSPAMIAEARRRHPAIDFREGDAEALTFPSASFDVVVMSFGLLHLARPETAIAEASRVLRPGGRYGFTVWSPPDQAIGFGVVLKALEAHGRTDVGLPEGPPFFRYSARDESVQALERAGFEDVSVRTIPLTWTTASADALFDAMSRGGVRTAAVLRAQTPDALAAIRAAVHRSVAPSPRGGVVELPMPAVLVTGRKQRV